MAVMGMRMRTEMWMAAMKMRIRRRRRMRMRMGMGMVVGRMWLRMVVVGGVGGWDMSGLRVWSCVRSMG
jgi:hypothetical protein